MDQNRIPPVDSPDEQWHPVYELDGGPGVIRIGLVALANDQVIERDLSLLKPDKDTLIYTSRIAFSGDCSLENLRRMSTAISTTVELISAEISLDAVIFGCTSGTVALGTQKIRKGIQSVRPDTICVDPITAVASALSALNIKRLAVLAPYTLDVLRPMVDVLTTDRCAVVNMLGLGILNSEHISCVTPESIFDNAQMANTEEADALFIACTDFRSLDVLTDIEKEIDKPVITSNQALMWHALRAVGNMSNVSHGGRLFRH